MDINLKNKNALVCGSTQGIGKAIALELASLGARVTLFARDPEKLEMVVRELDRSAGQDHDYLVADFFDTRQVSQVITNRIRNGAMFHILVNNTGGPPPGPITEADADAFLQGFNAHLVNNQHLVQALIPGMKKVKYGRIVNVISSSVKVPIAGLGVSNTIRGAVASWAKTLAGELGPHGITVNNILPGFTDTARLDALFERKSKEAGISKNEYVKKAEQDIPMRRLADPMETAYAAAFLASPSAAYITGINLPVDGGKTPCL